MNPGSGPVFPLPNLQNGVKIITNCCQIGFPWGKLAARKGRLMREKYRKPPHCSFNRFLLAPHPPLRGTFPQGKAFDYNLLPESLPNG